MNEVESWLEDPSDDHGSQISPTIAALGLLGLAVSGWLMTQRSPLPPVPLLALLAVVELCSVRLGAFGFFSVSGGLLLAAASLGTPGPALFVVLLALGLRTLIRPAPSSTQGALEFISDLVPHSLGTAVAVFCQRQAPAQLAFPLALLGYAFIWYFSSGFFQGCLNRSAFRRWTQAREALWTGLLGQLAGGYLVRQQPALWFALIPVLGAVLDSARRVRFQLDAVYDSGKKEKADVQLSQRQDQLLKARVVQDVQETRLEIQMESYQLIDKLLSSLRHSPSLKSIALLVLEQVRTRIACESAALYLEIDGALTIVAAITPHQDRVASATMLNLSEPLVERTWQRGKVQHVEPLDLHAQRVFSGEVHALAAPILDRGVIYVGSPHPIPISDRELQSLDSLARHSWLALQAARSQEEQQAAYQREQQARRLSEELLNRLADLVAGMNRLLPLNQPQQLVEAGARLVQELLRGPNPDVWIHFEGLDHNRIQGPKQGLQELVASALESRLPILHNQLAQSPFYQAESAYQCALVIPLLSQYGSGYIVAASQNPFERDDQDILSLLALQIGPILQTVRLYADLQITHQKLSESQAQLVQSSKLAAIGQLAGGVAHEINTPLGAVTISIDSAISIMGNRPERAQERLEKARKACARMKDIVAKLLFYSRDTASHRSLADLNQVVHDTLNFIGHQLQIDNVQVETSLGQLSNCMVNQNEVQQILINLLNNARDAVLMDTHQGPRKIWLGSVQQGQQCLIQVRDSGPGITADKVDKIFDPFYTSKPVGQGTGLGLSVSRELATQNGGTLDLLPQSQRGAVFELRFPVADPSQKPEEALR